MDYNYVIKIEEIVRIVDQELGYAGSSSNIKAKSKVSSSLLYLSVCT